jgi:chemotaxis protein methyltransferase CheR
MDRIASLAASRAGIDLPEGKLWLLRNRLADRQRQLDLTHASDYLALLEGPDGTNELDRLFESLRIGETRFFRQSGHLRAMVRVALPEITARITALGRGEPGGPNRTIKVWSAGCASGEEAYSIAITLEEWSGVREGGWSYKILATDLSQEALSRASAGTFDAGAVAVVPRQHLERYFVEEEQDQAGQGYRVSPRLRRRVSFEPHNLVADRYPRPFDLIFCCNVLFYFDTPTRQRVIQRMADSLEPHGYLFLGATEILPMGDPLSVLRTSDGVIYRQRAAVSDRQEQAAPVQRDREGSPGPGLDPDRCVGAHWVVRLSGSYDDSDGGQLAKQLRPALDRSPTLLVVDLDGATYLHPACARVLHRLASSIDSSRGGSLSLVASQPGAQRWLRRQEILAEVPRYRSIEEALAGQPRQGDQR